MITKLISDMTEAEIASASTDVLAKALVYRLDQFQSLIAADLEEVEARLPGFGGGGKMLLADGLEQLADSLRTSPLPPHWQAYEN